MIKLLLGLLEIGMRIAMAIRDSKTRSMVRDLKDAKTPDEKRMVAQRISSRLYND